MKRTLVCVSALVLCAQMVCSSTAQAEETAKKKILLIGQKRDHPPGAHQYMAGLRVLATCLKQVPEMEVKLVQADEPWRDGPALLRDVDGIVLSLGQGGRWIQNDPKRLEAIMRLAQKKTGIVAIHWAIGAQKGRYITPYREIIGCIHGGEDRKYIVCETELVVQAPDHPIFHGVHGLHIRDEWYYHLKRSPQGKIESLLAAVIDGQRETVGWAYTRDGGGRSFGFSGMHFHKNWQNESLRRMIVQAVLWTVHLPIPEKGIPVDVPPDVYKLNPDE